ncbi:lecithin retinol acyltransferase family protein [Providencia alcalifaciens]|jgi:cell wall-associated NlpC family hydrolase
MGTLNLKVGDHIYSPRTGYTHHGIYIGGDKVVHYAGLSHGLSKDGIQETTLIEFSGEKQLIGVVQHEYSIYTPEEIVNRARQKIGEDDYNVATNNCEHFANWCVTGTKESKQVQSVVKATVNVVNVSYNGYTIYKYLNGAQVGAGLLKTVVNAASTSALRTTAPTIINSTVASTTASSAISSFAATSTASNLAGVVGGSAAGITSGVAASGGTTVALSALTGVSAVGAAPVIVGVAVATGVGLGVKYLWGKIFD